MRAIGLLPVLFLLWSAATPAADFLDLEQETVHIPDTHETAAYRSDVLDNPDEYVSVAKFEVAAKPDGVQQVVFTVESTLPGALDAVHVFITDRKAESFYHVHPERTVPGAYVFEFHPRNRGRHRAEIILSFPWGTARVSRDLEVRGEIPAMSPADDDAEGYGVRLRTFPKDIYADHVVTFLYEITYQDVPVEHLEPVDGHDMILASWDLGWFSSFNEFKFGTSPQNLGGPEVAVSVVFEKPGKHVVFAQFKHKGKIRTVDAGVNVRLERELRDTPLDYNDRAF